MKLTKDDYAAVERSWISPTIADEAGLYRVASIEGRDLVGRKGGGDCAGIVFPYRWPDDPHSVLDRLRLDHPPVDAATGKPERKYLSPPGTCNHFYFPRCLPELVTDAAMPVVITEGEKKVLALWRMALESGNGAGKPAISSRRIAGVWCWRGHIGIRTTAKGERVPEKGVIPDFDRLTWTGRRVTIMFDTNAATNPSVGAARRGLAAELTRRGAEVWIADLPPAPAVNGVDDYVGLFGLSAALEVLKLAVRYEWRKELIRSDKDKILPVLANVVTTLRSAPEWCGVLAYDQHALTIATTRDTPWGAVERWEDHHTYLLVDWLQHHGIQIHVADANAAIETVARDRSYKSGSRLSQLSCLGQD